MSPRTLRVCSATAAFQGLKISADGKSWIAETAENTRKRHRETRQWTAATSPDPT